MRRLTILTMSLSTRCPHCEHNQDLTYAFWSGVRYKIECENCGTEINGFLAQQTVNWPRRHEKPYSPRVFPIEALTTVRPTFSGRIARIVNATIVWLRAPWSQQHPSRQFVR